MSRYPKQRLPADTDPAIVHAYAHTLDVARRHFYDPNAVVVIGRLPTRTDVPLGFEEGALDEAVREIHCRFDTNTTKLHLAHQFNASVPNLNSVTSKTLLKSDMEVTAVVSLRTVKPLGVWRRNDRIDWCSFGCVYGCNVITAY